MYAAVGKSWVKNYLWYQTLKKDKKKTTVSAAWAAGLKIVFLKPHCGRHCRLLSSIPSNPLFPADGEGLVWVLTILCSGKRVHVDRSKLSVTVPFPLPGLGLDVSMGHSLVEESKGTASQQDAIPPRQTPEDRLPGFAFTRGCSRMRCLELRLPSCDMKSERWERWRWRIGRPN